jgi:hypothetical protein
MNSNSRYVHATDCCDVLEQIGAYQRIKDPKEEEIGKNLPCSLMAGWTMLRRQVVQMESPRATLST